MSGIITRRSLLRGLFAMPAVVAASSLMPVRGIVQPIDAYVIDLPFGFVALAPQPSSILIIGIDQWGREIQERVPVGLNVPTFPTPLTTTRFRHVKTIIPSWPIQ